MKAQGLETRHVTERCAPERAFHFANGTSAASLSEFHTRLGSMPLDVVTYHRDHYAPWVRHVLGDEALALRFESYARTTPSPEAFRNALLELVANRLRQLGVRVPSRP